MEIEEETIRFSRWSEETDLPIDVSLETEKAVPRQKAIIQSWFPHDDFKWSAEPAL